MKNLKSVFSRSMLLLILFFGAIYARFVIDRNEIIAINTVQNDWIAGVNPRFVGKTLEEAKFLLGAFLPDPSNEPTIPEATKGTTFDLPEEFDVFEAWPKCKKSPPDQGYCGSDWAMAIADTITDRLCVATKGEKNYRLSSQDILSCDKKDYGCCGGSPPVAWQYTVDVGIVSEKCMEYTSYASQVRACPWKKCDDMETPWIKHYTLDGSVKRYTNDTIEQAMGDMMQKGSLQAAFDTYSDFFSYKKGVYHHVSGTIAGAHMVKLQGWGVDKEGSGMSYWNVMNTWGTEWGMDGFFWIQRGKNECKIEEYGMYAGDPELDR